MSKKVFWLLFSFILLLSLVVRIVPSLNNNFYFTMDQGNDAVHVREILARGQIPLLGPETSLTGLYMGPFWYWFISIGYILFGGHPFGAVFMLILLNVFLVGMLMWWLKKKISPFIALIIGFSLQFFWQVYDTSRYGFNPFPLVFLGFLIILSLIEVLEGRKRYFYLAALSIGLAFNAEIAGASTFALFTSLLGLFLMFRHRLHLTTYLFYFFIIGLFFLPHLISEFSSGFSQIHVLLKELHNNNGYFGGTKFSSILFEFRQIFNNSIVPQSFLLSLLILSMLIVFGVKNCHSQNKFTIRFAFLVSLLFLLSYVWFSFGRVWRDWQTIYLAPLIFVSILLLIFNLPRKIGILIFLIILSAQGALFYQRYLEYLTPSNDQSILVNELKAVDWIYRNSEGQGFNVYTYLPSVYDYPYQYLFWWYGLKKYTYLPCEYSSFPNSPKIFIPGNKYYKLPQKQCTNLRFLIIEPDERAFVQNRWLEEVKTGTVLIKEENVGEIRLEKRIIYPE